MRIKTRLLPIISASFLFISCSSLSYQPIFTVDPKGYASKQYEECLNNNPEDKAKCDMLKPDFMEPNLTEHKDREGYH